MNTWRSTGPSRVTVGDMGMSRLIKHVAPAQQHLAFGADGALEFLLAGQAGGVPWAGRSCPPCIRRAARAADAAVGRAALGAISRGTAHRGFATECPRRRP